MFSLLYLMEMVLVNRWTMQNSELLFMVVQMSVLSCQLHIGGVTMYVCSSHTLVAILYITAKKAVIFIVCSHYSNCYHYGGNCCAEYRAQ